MRQPLTMPQKRSTMQLKIKIYKYCTTYHKTPHKENLSRHKRRNKQRQRNKYKAEQKTTPTTPKKRDQSATTCRRIYSHIPKKRKSPAKQKRPARHKEKPPTIRKPPTAVYFLFVDIVYAYSFILLKFTFIFQASVFSYVLAARQKRIK